MEEPIIHKWRNPTCINGRLPPGSMGLPLIGETIQFFIPTKSLAFPAFLSKRIKKYGPVFRTSLVGRPVVVSADPDFNHYILQQEGRLTMFDFILKALFGYERDKSGEDMSKNLNNFIEGLMSIPLNIPGTSFHRCLQGQKKLLKLLKDAIQERRVHPEKHREDFLDQMLDDMKQHKFITDNTVTFLTFGLLLATVESMSSTITVTIKLLIEHPHVVEELMEHEEILKSRENRKGRITWAEYKSTTFTMQVIHESLRLGNIEVNGYTIPKGWTIFIVPKAIHLNPETYKDPLSFNPWRWKDLGASVTQKSFTPFGGGSRQCAGAEFSKLLLALCIHQLFTKYRWTKVKGGEIVRSPALTFRNGYYIKVADKFK